MQPTVLRDSASARQFLLQGLWLQRAVPPAAVSVRPALEWCLHITGEGHPLLPIGFIADFGQILLGWDRERRVRRPLSEIPGLPSGLLRNYEDLVLGKIYADRSMERASDALRQYAPGKERNRGLDYLFQQLRERCRLPGVELSTGVVRDLLEKTPEELLTEGWESLTTVGPAPILIDLYRSLILGCRGVGDLLALEDLAALEQRTATAEVGQYVAHRQIVQMANQFELALPTRKLRPAPGRREIATRIRDEDTYPVGGFSSISTRGTIESLLHSQLAYMETDRKSQPDLFDIKFLRDELYYYSRDENQFLRQRRSFLFVFSPDLTAARFKDPVLPYQRIVMLLALVQVVIRKLSHWLGQDALHFDLFFLQNVGARPLEQEAELCSFLFRQSIENKSLTLSHGTIEELTKRCKELARISIFHCLAIGTAETKITADPEAVTELRISSARPELLISAPIQEPTIAENPIDSWTEAIERLLRWWV